MPHSHQRSASTTRAGLRSATRKAMDESLWAFQQLTKEDLWGTRLSYMEPVSDEVEFPERLERIAAESKMELDKQANKL